MQHQPYTYEPLTQPTSIRILCLEPAANRDGPLRGTLIRRTVDETKASQVSSYKALLYVWGYDSTTESEILLHGRRAGIAKSLESALRDLRERALDIPSWVPDWRVPRRTLPALVEPLGRPSRRFNINQKYPAIIESHMSLMVGVGYIFNTVEMAGPIAPQLSASQDLACFTNRRTSYGSSLSCIAIEDMTRALILKSS